MLVYLKFNERSFILCKSENQITKITVTKNLKNTKEKLKNYNRHWQAAMTPWSIKRCDLYFYNNFSNNN